jgi:TRAP-type mannitol/chloroaromatic compound transport system permease large subunit
MAGMPMIAPATTCACPSGLITAGGTLGILLPPRHADRHGAGAESAGTTLFVAAILPGLLLASLFTVTPDPLPA